MRKKRLKVTFALLCLGALLLSYLPLLPTTARADMEKESTKRTIGIVFDNSGSMYQANRTAWSQAQYAMEVFASMMNEGDTLIIYPMNEVRVGGESSSESYTSESPFRITNREDAKKIREFFTPRASGTPPKSIDDAKTGLQNESGEKWLILLTDGTTFDGSNETQTQKMLSEKLTECATQMNVIYLGINVNGAPKKPNISYTSPYKGRTDVAMSSSEVPQKLTEMCNLIFGRDALSNKFISGNSFSFDIPMSKVYVFVQGENIDGLTLKQGGKEVKPQNTFSPKFGTLGAKDKNGTVCNNADTTLQGYLAIYESLDRCKNGENCEISFSGTKNSLSIYYEPDVDVAVQLIDPEGAKCIKGQDFPVGTYKLKYFLADKNGEQVESELLGKTDYEISYNLNGSPVAEKKSSSGEIPIQLDDQTVLSLEHVQAEILSGYRIEKRGSDLGFLSDGSVKASKTAVSFFGIDVTGGQDSYDPDGITGNAKYFASLNLEGQKITGSDLEDVQFTCEVPNSAIQVNTNKTKDGYEIELLGPDDVSQLNAGNYQLNCSATYSTDKVEAVTAIGSRPFTINDLSQNLSILLTNEKSYYSRMELEQEQGIVATVLLDGKELTREQQEQLVFSAVCEGIQLETTEILGQSAYRVRIMPGSNPPDGLYRIDFQAEGLTDRMGHKLVANNATKAEVGAMPEWLRTLLIILAIILGVLLLAFILTTPVLPNAFAKNIKGELNSYESNWVNCTTSGSIFKKKITYRCKNVVGIESAMITFTVKPTSRFNFSNPSWLILFNKYRHMEAIVNVDKVTRSRTVQEATIAGKDIDFANAVTKKGNKEKRALIKKTSRITVSGEAGPKNTYFTVEFPILMQYRALWF